MNLVEAARLLTSTGWLSRQPPKFQEAILAIGNWRDVEPGTTINRAGDDSGGVWGIAAGQMNLTSALGVCTSPVGDIQLPVSWGGFGPIFRRPRGANGTARLQSLVLYVTQARLELLLRENPRWWQAMGELATDVAFRYAGGLGDALIRNTQERCAAILLRLADCRQRDRELGLPVTIACSQDEFAALANLSRQRAGIVLRDLAETNFIELGYRTITIASAEPLRAMIDEK